jgi:6-phosphogluconolactonase
VRKFRDALSAWGRTSAELGSDWVENSAYPYAPPRPSAVAMKRPLPRWPIPVTAALLLLLLAPAAASAQTTNAPGHENARDVRGAVFTMSNAVAGNSVLAYTVGAEGQLASAGNFSTGGTGTGVSLADSGALALTADHRFLFVVNAGDNSVSVFAVRSPSGGGPILALVDVVASQGLQPVSLAVHGAIVYVLNAGNATTGGNIAGFFLTFWGKLYPIPGSVQPLSTGAPTGPAEIAFDPSGTVLVVTEKATSVLDAYPVNFWGVAGGPVVTPSNGSTPYGFAFSEQGTLVVSDAGPGALSSYHVARNGQLTVVSGTVEDGQLAPCWVAVSGVYAFTTNAHSNTISTYQVGRTGALSLVSAIAATTGAADTDMALAGTHAQYLLIYDAGAGEIQEFQIGPGGSLSPLADVASLPATAEGLAAF